MFFANLQNFIFEFFQKSRTGIADLISLILCIYVLSPVLSACTANSKTNGHKYPVVTWCGHSKLAVTVD